MVLNRKLIDDSDTLNITHAHQSKKSKKWTVHVETSGTTYKKLLNSRMDMGWTTCHVFEDLRILRCYKCGAFGHKAMDCKHERKCTYCAGLHDRSQCNKEVKKCVNCYYVCHNYNAAHKFDHDSEDEAECPILAKKCRLAREKINYETVIK